MSWYILIYFNLEVHDSPSQQFYTPNYNSQYHYIISENYRG